MSLLTIQNIENNILGMGDHFRVLKVSEGTCTFGGWGATSRSFRCLKVHVLRTYLPTIGYNTYSIGTVIILQAINSIGIYTFCTHSPHVPYICLTDSIHACMYIQHIYIILYIYVYMYVLWSRVHSPPLPLNGIVPRMGPLVFCRME